MIWSSDTSPSSGRRSMKRVFCYNSEEFHKSPPKPKHQKVDVTSKSSEYIHAEDPTFASSRTVVVALPSTPNTLKHRIQDSTRYESVEVRRNYNDEMEVSEGCENCNFDNTSINNGEAKLGHRNPHPNKGKHRKLSFGHEKVNSAPTNERSLEACRERVLDVLQHFKGIYNKLLEESKEDQSRVKYAKRSLPVKAASLLKQNKKWIRDNPTFGIIPGVEIGDTYQFRAELSIVGLHLQYLASIEYTDFNGGPHVTSIVDSGHFESVNSECLDTLTYVGHGENHNDSSSSTKKLNEQKFEKGNLALKNSKDSKLPIRVICLQKTLGMSFQGYIYAGLYVVSNYKQERDQRGKMVFKFELCRLCGQPNLTLPLDWDWVEVKKPQGDRGVKNLVVVDDDVSQGKEKFSVRAINDLDNEKPPPFIYITKMIKPFWFNPPFPKGCNCKNGCSYSKKCVCTLRNGGEIPFNNIGSIIKAKPVVYECGPSCNCPPSCKNRVSQNGLQYHLEIFKTKSRGWGVRSRDHISSGSFICEYIGELLDENEAEKRIDCDEYLFDIGNYDEGEEIDLENIHRKDSEGFTIDAAWFGNVGRFFNHSCSPNLYAQNVLFDHDDKRAPHLMLFAQEDIPPLQELTYDYNYKLDQVRDSNGNLKKKNCYCGAQECTGRMY
ncbi:unnamed protein product [Cuscuta epithymum]|uniref:Uncharacterized protein n=1 Tax=Cuscuta epithymum TaxID=186058 RepID=A0AAV0FCJ5_9ASTE|nr:unnamed protein product [Cuscuta epithymum]